MHFEDTISYFKYQVVLGELFSIIINYKEQIQMFQLSDLELNIFS